MNIRHFAVIGAAVVILALAGIIMFAKPQTQLRRCGHPHNFSSRISSITGLRFGSTHCCYANSVIADLKQIGAAMEIYRMENAAYPTSFDALTNYIGNPRFPHYQLQSDEKHWIMRVPQHSGLPGHYLFADQGDHFTSTRSSLLRLRLTTLTCSKGRILEVPPSGSAGTPRPTLSKRSSLLCFAR